jgi:hypothetical protein
MPKKVELFMDGLPVREAKRAIKLVPVQGDLKKAKQQDPTCCVAACAWKRQFDVDKVYIYRSRTYVLWRGDKFWTRYKTPVRLAANTVTFDKARIFDLEDYYFNRLQPTQRAAIRKKRLASGQEKRSEASRSKNPESRRPRRRISAMTNVRGTAHLSKAA